MKISINIEGEVDHGELVSLLHYTIQHLCAFPALIKRMEVDDLRPIIGNSVEIFRVR